MEPAVAIEPMKQSTLTMLLPWLIELVLLTSPALSQVLHRETVEAGYPKAR
jgi:hypothetical protein